eukprot:8135937-Pyramimonas_sp.AAC.1
MGYLDSCAGVHCFKSGGVVQGPLVRCALVEVRGVGSAVVGKQWCEGRDRLLLGQGHALASLPVRHVLLHMRRCWRRRTRTQWLSARRRP